VHNKQHPTHNKPNIQFPYKKLLIANRPFKVAQNKLNPLDANISDIISPKK